MPAATKKTENLQFANAEKALRDAEFSDEDIAALVAGEAEHGPVINWAMTTFTEVLDAIRGRAAFGVIREMKAGVAEDAGAAVSLPAEPPYLGGDPKAYDPKDPSQYYTDPETGEMYRWDGKGRSKTGYRNALNILVDRPGPDRMPFGQPHRVAIVPHKRYQGTPLPDERAARAAIAAGQHWFHQGYGCWIGEAGKLLADPSPEVRLKVSLAMKARERDYDNDPSRPMGRIPAHAG